MAATPRESYKPAVSLTLYSIGRYDIMNLQLYVGTYNAGKHDESCSAIRTLHLEKIFKMLLKCLENSNVIKVYLFIINFESKI